MWSFPIRNANVVAAFKRVKNKIKYLRERLANPRTARRFEKALNAHLAETGILPKILKRRFTTEGKSGGFPWGDLSPETQTQRRKQGFPGPHPILMRTGTLRDAVVKGIVTYDADGVYLDVKEGVPAPIYPRQKNKGKAITIAKYALALDFARPFLQEVDENSDEGKPMKTAREKIANTLMQRLMNGQPMADALRQEI